MQAALRAGDQTGLGAIRMLRAAIQRREVDQRIELDDAGVVAVVQKLVKQSQDAIAQFEAGNRPDLVASEQAGIDVLKRYLPSPLSEGEIGRLIDAAIAEIGATSMRDMGRVVSAVKSQAEGRADMRLVSEKIKTRLQG